MELPFSQACENNKQPILDQLKTFLSEAQNVFEIGSGTGQHAVFFAEHLPHLIWQTSDCAENIPFIQRRIRLSGLPNLPDTVPFEIGRSEWPAPLSNAFSANTAHIMAWELVEQMVDGIGRHLTPGGLLILYGPFNYGGNYTSDSNRTFDAWLKSRALHQGIRDFEAIDRLALAAKLVLQADVAMPANNRLLVWRKSGFL